MMPRLADILDAYLMAGVKRWVPRFLLAGVVLGWAGAVVMLAWAGSL